MTVSLRKRPRLQANASDAFERSGLGNLTRSLSDQHHALRLELLPDPETATEGPPSTDLNRACGGERPSAARRRRLVGV